MYKCILFILFPIIVLTHTSKPRSVNVALETVLEFNNEEDVKFIDSIKQFLDKIKRTIVSRNSNTANKRSDLKDRNLDKDNRFTQFLSKTLSILKSLNDDDLKKFVTTLKEEVAKWEKENGEIPDKLGFRRLINTNLRELTDSPDDIRRKLNAFSRGFNYNSRHGTDFITDVLNYFYSRESHNKLSRILNKLNLYRTRARRSMIMDLKRIIRSGIEALAEPLLKIDAEFKKQKNVGRLTEKGTDSKKNNRNVSKEKVAKLVKKIPPKVKKEDTIIDYIDEHKRVVEKYFKTPISGDSSDVFNSERSKEIGYLSVRDDEYTHSKTNKKNLKMKQRKDSSSEVQKKLRKSQKEKSATLKVTKKDRNRLEKNSQEKDINDIKEPILITIGSSKETDESSDSDSENESTTTRHTQQKRYKKFTRPQTSKKRSSVKTTKYARKAFRTTFNSDEGLSIEHFGSLFTKKSHRKNNDNDTLTQSVNTNLPQKDENDCRNITSNVNIDSAKNFTEQRKRYIGPKIGHKIATKTTDRTSEGSLGRGILSENITITGEIVVEALNKKTEVTVVAKATPVDFRSNTKHESKLESTLTTKNSNFNVKPTTLRKRDFNETDFQDITTIKSEEMATTRLTTTKKKEKTSGIKEERTTEKVRNDLENELISIIDRHNTSSTIPGDIDNFIKETDDEVKNNDVVNEMKADFAKILTALKAQ